MKSILVLILAVVLSGCCGMSGFTPPSTSCQLGTYGSACTNFCEKAAGTQFDGGPSCVSDCTDLVRQQGLGDATTCCTETISQQCQITCGAKVSDLVRKYGVDVVTPEEQQDTMDGCIAECTGAFVQMDIPLDSCSVFDIQTLLDLQAGD